jgi:hypothetical protein
MIRSADGKQLYAYDVQIQRVHAIDVSGRGLLWRLDLEPGETPRLAGSPP